MDPNTLHTDRGGACVQKHVGGVSAANDTLERLVLS